MTVSQGLQESVQVSEEHSSTPVPRPPLPPHLLPPRVTGHRKQPTVVALGRLDCFIKRGKRCVCVGDWGGPTEEVRGGSGDFLLMQGR